METQQVVHAGSTTNNTDNPASRELQLTNTFKRKGIIVSFGRRKETNKQYV
ncbi:unnamed protein product [Brassica rapa subsp. trilocularis]